jgi:hypothetical protein
MQRMTKITLPVVLTYDGSAITAEVQALVANLMELARIDSRLSTDSQHAVEVGCTSATVQFPKIDVYILYKGPAEVCPALEEYCGSFDEVASLAADNESCTLEVFDNYAEFRPFPAGPKLIITPSNLMA